MPEQVDIQNPVQGVQAIVDYLIDTTNVIPDDVRERLRGLVAVGNSPVVSSVEAMELIYARRDELPPELLSIGVALARVNTDHGFHGLREDGRGAAITNILKAMPGVSAPIPAPVSPEPPEPKQEYLPQPEEEEGEEEDQNGE